MKIRYGLALVAILLAVLASSKATADDKTGHPTRDFGHRTFFADTLTLNTTTPDTMTIGFSAGWFVVESASKDVWMHVTVPGDTAFVSLGVLPISAGTPRGFPIRATDIRFEIIDGTGSTRVSVCAIKHSGPPLIH